MLYCCRNGDCRIIVCASRSARFVMSLHKRAPAACTVPGFPVLAGSVGGLVVGARPTVQRTRRFSSQSAESFAIPIERGGLSLKSRDVFLLPVWVSAHYVPLSPDLDRLAASVISPLGWAIHPTCA
jgi:hypothetical protein